MTLPKNIRKRNTKKTRERHRRILRERRRRILHRLENQPGAERDQPMITATDIHYELAERAQGLSAGGIGAMLLVARTTGLIRDIDHDLHLLKRHLPYHESDHVLNIALNVLAGGQCLDHIELRRNDEVYLNALGAHRIPDPTTEGDFCRRFTETDVQKLMDTLNGVRLRVWAQQPPEFFDRAILDVDGTLVATDAQCKQGVDIAYNGTWGYHPLILSLANTAEPLYLVNRSGNRPSHEQADVYLDKAIALCRQAGFRTILLRADTDFSQTTHLDRWDQAGDIRFYFGIDAMPNLKALAEQLPAQAYSFLERPPRSAIKTVPRQRSEPVKEQIVRRRKFETIHLLEEMVAEFNYRPVACKTSYRMIVLRKRLGIDKGGVRALTTPLDNLISNWAYMVMASLAWSLKAWSALLVPVTPRHAEQHGSEKRAWLRMEFATFRAAVIAMPCQLVRSGGRLIDRLLSWTPWQGVFLRLVERLHGCWLY
jgi:hypothetical protein